MDKGKKPFDYMVGFKRPSIDSPSVIEANSRKEATTHGSVLTTYTNSKNTTDATEDECPVTLATLKTREATIKIPHVIATVDPTAITTVAAAILTDATKKGETIVTTAATTNEAMIHKTWPDTLLNHITLPMVDMRCMMDYEMLNPSRDLTVKNVYESISRTIKKYVDVVDAKATIDVQVAKLHASASANYSLKLSTSKGAMKQKITSEHSSQDTTKLPTPPVGTAVITPSFVINWVVRLEYDPFAPRTWIH
ncbi:hypothetical protein L1987_32962 [Smallanthus sonchifolius]|uniref:Uncharacterized protein n=1 Tax=Smallanthus sonchifolius TaxID=185202 RepID=A0ACB9HPH3_9ASTR|nr:hypothetical protein L1987_32962 [Smallanthus sonchifolius]